MTGSPSPNPIRVAVSVAAAMRKRHPNPHGMASVDHGALAAILADLETGGVGTLPGRRADLAAYRGHLEAIDPDDLERDEALAYWLNLYNAGALDLAADAVDRADGTVLRVPGGFTRPWARVAGEHLSLEQIEHAKIRRFGDPRIHGALVCGSASCPTLRYEPYRGRDLDGQLDDQLAGFLAGGGAAVDPTSNVLSLSRILLWYGSDFSRPHRMPTWVPTTRRRLVESLARWLDPGVTTWVRTSRPRVTFQSYDWSLACAVG